MEIWKSINESNRLFEISNYGKIRNEKKELVNFKKTGGYFVIFFKQTKKSYYVHRLVAKYFLLNFENNKMVNHIDFNKENNHFFNLEMVTNRENQCHLVKSKNKFIGISYHIRLKQWTAQIMVNKKLKYIGKYKTEIEAYQARVNFEKNNQIDNKYL